MQLQDSFAAFGKTVDETHQGVQALKDENDRIKTLTRIRNTLQVSNIVLLDTRTTQTGTNYATQCLPGTGSWIWTNKAFVSWKEGAAKGTDQATPNVLIVSGPPSSGKTFATAQIVKNSRKKKAAYRLPITSSCQPAAKSPRKTTRAGTLFTQLCGTWHSKSRGSMLPSGKLWARLASPAILLR